MSQNILAQAQKIHFIGIGGIGISAIARMCLAQGKKVSGSDSSESEITEALKKLGAEIFIGQKAENIKEEIDLFIYTVAVKSDNPEFIAAQNTGIKMVTYAETLNEISRSKYTIAVAGTHGKTTTTAMIAKIMIDLNQDPTVIVGSLVRDWNNQKTNFLPGQSKYFVVEACEYDRSFLNIEPKIAVINNIDNDHLDYYGSIEGVIAGFREFALKIPADGFIVCDPQDERIAKVITGLKCNIIDRNKFFDSNLHLMVYGEHNRKNAATALAVISIFNLDLNLAKKSLEKFSGTWRRFEFKGKTKKGVLVYEDYGHHPTEIKATLLGARELYPRQKITVVFQPHLFSRTKLLLNDFATAFNTADEVILTPIFPAREPFDGTISSEILAEKIKKHKQDYSLHLTQTNRSGSNPVCAFPNFDSIVDYLSKTLQKDDVVITMGAGEQYKIGDSLLNS